MGRTHLMEESGMFIMGNTLAWYTAQSNNQSLLSYDGMKMELVEKHKNGVSVGRIKRLYEISPLHYQYVINVDLHGVMDIRMSCE
jgi:hypothetical protein